MFNHFSQEKTQIKSPSPTGKLFCGGADKLGLGKEGLGFCDRNGIYVDAGCREPEIPRAASTAKPKIAPNIQECAGGIRYLCNLRTLPQALLIFCSALVRYIPLAWYPR